VPWVLDYRNSTGHEECGEILQGSEINTADIISNYCNMYNVYPINEMATL
jgi:hypothetical protein